jgi:hypothetical protein
MKSTQLMYGFILASAGADAGGCLPAKALDIAPREFVHRLMSYYDPACPCRRTRSTLGSSPRACFAGHALALQLAALFLNDEHRPYNAAALKEPVEQTVQHVSSERMIAKRNASQIFPGDPGKMDEHVAVLGITENEPRFAFIGDAMVGNEISARQPQELCRPQQQLQFFSRPAQLTDNWCGHKTLRTHHAPLNFEATIEFPIWFADFFSFSSLEVPLNMPPRTTQNCISAYFESRGLVLQERRKAPN